MILHPIDIAIIAAYLVFCLVIGFMKFGKIRNIRDYTLGTKPFSTSVLVATTFATFVGSKQIIGNIAKVYELGMIFIIPLFLTPVSWFIIAKAFVSNLDNFHKLRFMSLGDIMGHWYGRKGQMITNILSVFVVMSVSATSTIAIGYLLHYFTGIPETLGMLTGVSIVTLYSAFGGINSVAFTDVFQFLIFFIALPLACFTGYHQSGGLETIINALPENHLNIGSSNIWFFLSLMFYSLSPHTGIPYIQRALIAKDKKQFTDTFIGIGVLFIPFLIMVSFIGLTVYKLNPSLNSNVVLYYFIDHYLGIGIKGLMIAGGLAIIMSTQDSYLNTVSAVIAHDFGKKIWPFLTEKQELLTARIACITISLLSIIIALFKLNIIEIIWLSQNFWMPLVTFPLLAGLLGARISKRSFNVLVVASLSATVIVRSFTGVFDTRSLVAGVIASIAVLYFGNRRYKKQHPELIQKKTPRESLIIRLQNSLFSETFSNESLYVVSIILCIGAVTGAGYLGFQKFNFLNISFLIVATGFLVLLLGGFWDFSSKYEITLGKGILIYGLLILPSYMLFTSNFNVYWIINLLLSVFLFVMFFNPVKMIVYGFFCFSYGYIFNNFFTHTEVIPGNTFSLGYGGFIIVSIIISLYQAKHVSREVVRQLETKVGERTSELKKALYVKQEFLNKLSHEIRTPVHAITGIANILSEEWQDFSEETRKKYVDILSQSGDRLKDYTSNILDLASIRQNKFTLHKEEKVDVIEIIKEIIRNSKSLILAKNKKLKIRLEEKEILPLINCDPVKIGQIVHNLLDNAIKYSEKGEILVSVEKQGNKLKITVSDEGVGIPDEEKEKIFESFYESSRTKTNAKGTGLGLAIVKEFVDLHNGTVKVENNKPKGSVFIVKIPC